MISITRFFKCQLLNSWLLTCMPSLWNYSGSVLEVPQAGTTQMCEERQLVSQVILLAISKRIKDELLIRH